MMSPPEEIQIDTPHCRFAGKRWGNRQGIPVLGLHGWLDNAATFDRLAPLLPNIQFVALDLVGHGWSDHRPPGVKYHYLDYIDDVCAVADVLQWGRFCLLGHSLGAGISCIVTGTFPERIIGLILIEGLGPMIREIEKAPYFLARSIQQSRQYLNKTPTAYPNLEAVIEARSKVGDMEASSVRLLMTRAVKTTGSALTWRSDGRLKITSPQYFTEAQVLAFLRQITCPTLLIQGNRGLVTTAVRKQEIAGRCACIQQLRVVTLAGGHHLHLDNPEPVAEKILVFLSEIEDASGIPNRERPD